MKRSRLSASLLALAITAPTFAQELPQPTAEHQQLAGEAGVWDAKARFWPAPGAPAMESTGTETCEMFGGFWLISKYEGSFGGMPYSGVAQTGYDTETGEYLSTWIDTMTPAMFVSRGGYDAETHTLTLVGESKDWMTGEMKQVKSVTVYPDDDHKRFEMHERADESDDWFRTLAIDYVRRK